MPCVIIPAHNEQDVIERCLNALTADHQPEDFQIIVCCNGCSPEDKTAQIASTYPNVTVLETEIGNKSNAMNLADQHATSFPRIYLDADCQMTTTAAKKLIQALQSTNQPRIAGLKANINTDNTNFLVKSYYKIWLQLPFCTDNMIGSGAYAFNEAGHQRLGEFPKLLAEDEYVRLIFADDERIVVKDEVNTVYAPKSFRMLIRLRARWNRGVMQIAHLYPHIPPKEPRNYNRNLKQILKRPDNWIPFLIYCTAWGLSKLRTKWECRSNDTFENWTRDHKKRDASATQTQAEHNVEKPSPEIVITTNTETLEPSSSN